MKIIYQSRTYLPELVTGKYVRCTGRKPQFVFRVFETVDGTTGAFKGHPGYGPTIREYDCDGSEIPENIRDRAIASKMTEQWK